MAISESTFDRARRYKRDALEAMLAAPYPVIYRAAHALAGQDKVGRNIVHMVMARALRAMPTWRDADMAERWFYHHTILAARQLIKRDPKPEQDLLVADGGPADPQYVAFIRALRTLAPQQREVFVLHHGERMNLRSASIAMDCSTLATQHHLAAAEQALSAVAGGEYEALKARLAAAYARLSPQQEWIGPAVSAYAARGLLPRRIKRLLVLFLLLAAAAGAAWAYMRFFRS